MKLLLTSVFGPYGVDDEYGEKENKMELFHNQVTREQGIFSYRFNHGSRGSIFWLKMLICQQQYWISNFNDLNRNLKEGMTT